MSGTNSPSTGPSNQDGQYWPVGTGPSQDHFWPPVPAGPVASVDTETVPTAPSNSGVLNTQTYLATLNNQNVGTTPGRPGTASENPTGYLY
jgi:hypothetical protein